LDLLNAAFTIKRDRKIKIFNIFEVIYIYTLGITHLP
jgi:hypothetical protein